ncbi:acyltransferase family protein [Micromonospora sp. NPDC007208]|uniref:acyltransferase family protein n=1 Tax=Micromonospora sp. NPDC007208 TaxID=3364236 RepID=UPI003692A515
MTATEATHSDAEIGTQHKRRYARYDGLRGICAIFVVIYHIGYQSGISELPGHDGVPILGSLVPAFRIFLPPFFVLSGLLLYRPFARAIIAGTPRPAPGPFIVGRALRLLPAFYVLTVVVMFTLNLSAVDGAWEVIKPFILLHYWFTPDMAQWWPGMEHTWTVPVEMSYYLALPILAWLINRSARRGTDPAARARRIIVPFVVMTVIGTAWTIFCYLPSQAEHTYYFVFWPLGYAGFFAAGMALATLSAYRDVTGVVPALHRAVAKRPMLWWLGALAALLLYIPKPFAPQVVVGTWPAMAQHLVEYVLFFAFGLLAVVPLTVPEVRSRFMDAVLTNPPIRYIGRLSYGVYLWNVPVMYYYFQYGTIFGNQPLGLNDARPTLPFGELVGFVLYVIVGTALFTLVSYYVIERPALRLRHVFNAPISALELGYATAPADDARSADRAEPQDVNATQRSTER